MTKSFVLNGFMFKIVLIASLIGGVLLTGCSNKQAQTPTVMTNYFNPEMIGHWSNDTGCSIGFAKDGNHYLVTSFSDAKGHKLTNFIVDAKKKSIMTEFAAQDKSVRFSGNFAEGMLVINDYCDDALHKVSY